MSFSNLVNGILRTNNCSRPRNHSIDTITPHYMAWYTDAETCCESFVPSSRQASANYCIGKDGEIWGNVDEENRAWTSGSSSNDNRAITIECANYVGGANDSKLPDATWNSLIKLCVDICQRYGKKRLVYRGSANYAGLTSTEMLLTMHKWFQSTDCPGAWLSQNFARLANEVTKILEGGTPTPTPPMVFGGTYECRVSTLNVRTEPNTNCEVVAEYHYGDIVELDDWYTSNEGLIWGRYTGASSGLKRYVAVGRDTGQVEDDDYLVKI